MMNGWNYGSSGYYPGAVQNTASNPAVFAVHYFLGVFTWLLIIAVLVALLRWLWKKGNGK